MFPLYQMAHVLCKGIPCLYVLSCLNYIRDEKIELYTDSYFHTEIWKKCYIWVIHSIPSQDLWPHFSKTKMLTPPKVKRKPSRPKKARHKDPIEKAKPKRLMKPQWTCSKCKQFGHNIRSCINEPAPQKPNDKSGFSKKIKLRSNATNAVNTNVATKEVILKTFLLIILLTYEAVLCLYEY